MKALIICLLPFLLACQITNSNTADEFRYEGNNLSELYGNENEQELHPYLLIEKALVEWNVGNKDPAVFWLYAGQLRYRFHLVANPNLDSSGEPALFASLMSIAGQINLYASGNPKKLAGQIQEVLDWDENTPNLYTSKVDNSDAFIKVRTNLKELKEKFINEEQVILETRKQQGIGRIGLYNGVYIEERNALMPKDWPTLNDTYSANSFNGNYKNAWNALVDSIFFPNDHDIQIEAEYFEFTLLNEDVLQVIAFNEVGEQIGYSEKNIKFSSSGVTFSNELSNEEAQLKKGRETESVFLYMNVDNELVIKRFYETEGENLKGSRVKYSFTYWNRAERFVEN